MFWFDHIRMYNVVIFPTSSVENLTGQHRVCATCTVACTGHGFPRSVRQIQTNLVAVERWWQMITQATELVVEEKTFRGPLSSVAPTQNHLFSRHSTKLAISVWTTAYSSCVLSLLLCVISVSQHVVGYRLFCICAWFPHGGITKTTLLITPASRGLGSVI